MGVRARLRTPHIAQVCTGLLAVQPAMPAPISVNAIKADRGCCQRRLRACIDGSSKQPRAGASPGTLRRGSCLRSISRTVLMLATGVRFLRVATVELPPDAI